MALPHRPTADDEQLLDLRDDPSAPADDRGSVWTKVAHALPVAIALVDETSRIRAVNARWRSSPLSLASLRPGDDLAAAWEPRLVGEDDQHPDAALEAADRHHLASVGAHAAEGLRRVLDGRRQGLELQVEVPVGDTRRSVLVLISPVDLPDGRGAAVTLVDTTLHRGVDEMLLEMAFHDALTALPNRLLGLDRLRSALDRVPGSDRFVAVLFVDLDGFKAVNDEHGHAVGDRVLVEAARRLRRAIRDDDTCCRWGGDEFVIILEVADVAIVPEVGHRVAELFAHPFTLPDGQVTLGASTGVAVARPGERAEALVARADRAMYEVKQGRRD